jgi:hypothetical protein
MTSRVAEEEDHGLQTHGGPESARLERGMEVSLKNILTAIDLSDCSCEAARYALGPYAVLLAQKSSSSAKLILLHVTHKRVVGASPLLR